MGRGDGLDMYPQLEGGFGFMRVILPMWGLGAKYGSKTKSLKNEIESKNHFFRFGLKNILEVNQKSASYVFFEIHIYID